MFHGINVNLMALSFGGDKVDNRPLRAVYYSLMFLLNVRQALVIFWSLNYFFFILYILTRLSGQISMNSEVTNKWLKKFYS